MRTRLLSICLMLCFTQGMMAQLTSLGLVEESNIPSGINRPYLYYVPQMQFVGDGLYVATPEGLYIKDVSNKAEEWSKLPVTDTLVVDFAVRGDTLAVLTREMLHLSTDRGMTYTTIPLEVFVGEDTDGSQKLYHVTFHPHDAQRIYVAYRGVSYSSDFGKTWEKLPFDKIPVGTSTYSSGPADILFNPNDPTHLVTYGNYSFFNSSDVLQSCDGGVSWSRSYYNGGVSEIYNVAFHPTDKNKMIVCGSETYLMQEQQGQRLENVYKPDSKYYEVLVNLFDVIYDTRNPNILYGADMVTMVDNNIVILRSVDGGMIWQKFYTIECSDADHALKLAIKDNILAIYSYASGIYLLDVDAVDTSISPVVNSENTATYYDLMGRKVDSPTRGIYIREGRKVIVE